MCTRTNSENTNGSNMVSDITRIPWPFIVVSILAGVAFWGTFAYSIYSGNDHLALVFGKIIGVMIGVFVPVSILYKLYQQFIKS